MVEVKDLSSKDNSRVKNCCINSNLHRLAVIKAEEDIRFEILRSDGSSIATNKPRHSAINCSREKFNYSANQVKHLVSLFFRGGLHFDVNPSYWKSFELLKRLDFEGFGLKALSEMVGKLVCLQYLGLRNNFLQELPQSLCSLERLEVLDIAQNFMVKLSDIIRKMGSLRHLYMSDIICWEPLTIDSLMNLQTLTYISVDSWIYELSGLEMMSSLRKLGMEEFDGASDVSKTFASLVKLENLECLILRGSRFRSMPSLDELGVLNRLTQLKLDGVLPRLTSPNCFPPMIRYLTLANSSLDEDPMPVLENLSELGFVKLRNAFTGEQMVVSKLGFAKLRVLCIGELWSLKSLQVGEGAIPKLERVEIQNCPRLKVLPQEVMFTKCIARKK
ncbi:probable disease resistance RPP8-like protein 2 [Salvia hispanica]|uniref:probable disease resistance RPP8-like protein 2 n=1 Tax=Salvia hispanica TaxID=49212 RepID=UPI002009073D|nr:probable disease resistance RPP8-like protein 2 [Salvia hispanica]